MRTIVRIALITGLVSASAARAEDGRPLILVHTMPWFASKPVSGGWGWHWTMGRFDPERTDASGSRAIASHYYPLIGPYDSSDPDVLEYHDAVDEGRRHRRRDRRLVRRRGLQRLCGHPSQHRRTLRRARQTRA